MTKKIMINEATLKKIVAESVRRVLKEHDDWMIGDVEDEETDVPFGEVRRNVINGKIEQPKEIKYYLSIVYRDIVKDRNFNRWYGQGYNDDLKVIKDLALSYVSGWKRQAYIYAYKKMIDFKKIVNAAAEEQGVTKVPIDKGEAKPDIRESRKAKKSRKKVNEGLKKRMMKNRK